MLNKAADEATAPHTSRAKSNDVAVCFNSVTKRFGEIVALHELSLAIKRGEFMTSAWPLGLRKDNAPQFGRRLFQHRRRRDPD